MRFIEDLIPLRLYPASKKLFIPIDLKNKKKGSAIILLSPTSAESQVMANLPYVYNPNYFNSYYISRDVTAYIDDGKLEMEAEDDTEEAVQESFYYTNGRDKIEMEFDKSVSSATKRKVEVALNTENWFKETVKTIKMNDIGKIDFTIYEHRSYEEIQKYTGKKGIHGYADADSVRIVSESNYTDEDGEYENYIKHEIVSMLLHNINPDINPVICAFVSGYFSGQYKDKKVAHTNTVNGSKTLADLIKAKGYGPVRTMIRTNDIGIIANFAGRNVAGKFMKLFEASMPAKERNALPDSEFGIPSQRKYPLNDEAHVRAAIKMFNHVDSAHEEELARRIKSKMKKFGIDDVSVGNSNRFSKYYTNKKESKKQESAIVSESFVIPEEIKDPNSLSKWMKSNIRYDSSNHELYTPEFVFNEKKGNCHDQVLFEMYILKKLGYRVGSLFLFEHDGNGNGGETHSVCYYFDKSSTNWFENAWTPKAGIHRFDSVNKLIDAFKNMHQSGTWGNHTKYPELEIETFRGKAGMSLQEIVDVCLESAIVSESIINKNNDIMYHGSNQHYSILKANSKFNNKKENVIYASPDYSFALSYAGAQWNDLDINQSVYNGKIYLTEIQPNKFEEIYDRPGYIHIISSKTFKPFHGLEYVSTDDAHVIEVKKINNVLNELKKSKNVKLYFYPNLPPFIKDREEYIQNTIKRWNEFVHREDCINISESSLKSTLDPNFKAKGHKSLSNFKKVKIDKAFVDKNKDEAKFLRHIKLDNSVTSYAWLDKNGTIAAIASVEYDHPEKGCNWIEAVEVTKPYKGYGLGTQLINYAVSSMKGNALTVAMDNEIAKRMYEKAGFKISKDSEADVKAGIRKVYFMYKGFTPSNAIKEANLQNKKADMTDHINMKGEKIEVRKKISENPNDPVGKEAHDISFYFENGKKFGEISISAVDSNKAFLYNFEVKEEYRGKGYGTEILKYVMRNYKVNELTVDKSNTRAINLYKRFGFKVNMDFVEDGIKRVDMKINLNESYTFKLLNEGIILNGKNIELNFDKWKREKGKNILFITGLSGSGKSTLAEEYEKKYNAYMFELDGLEHRYDSSGNAKILEKVREECPDYDNYYKDHSQKVINNINAIWNAADKALEIMKNDYKNLYIVEGVQLFDGLYSYDQLKNKPLIIIDSSHLQSIIRAIKRTAKNDNKSILDVIKDNLGEILSYHKNSYTPFKKFKDKMKSESYIAPGWDNKDLKNNGYYVNEDFIRVNTGDSEFITFFTEDSNNFFIRRYLYKERLKNSAAVMQMYSQIKQDNPWIKKTFPKIGMYSGNNVFVDVSYYNGLFIQNNIRRMDKGVELYWDFVNRLINNKEIDDIYGKKTIFIPVDRYTWGTGNVDDFVNYKVNLNPISMIFRMMKTHPELIAREWGNKTFLFVGKRGYFTIDFSTFKFANLARIRHHLTKLFSDTEPIIDDENPKDSMTPDEDSSAVIAAKVTEKINNKLGTDIPLTAVSKSYVDNLPIDKAEDLVFYHTNKVKIPEHEKNYIAILGTDSNVGLARVIPKLQTEREIDSYVKPKE